MALYGIYGRHEIRDCPLNNSETRKMVAEIAKMDMSSVLPKYKINRSFRIWNGYPQDVVVGVQRSGRGTAWFIAWPFDHGARERQGFPRLARRLRRP